MSESTPATAVRGRLTEEGISLEIGHAEKGPDGSTGQVRLSDRIVLTPSAARHLAIGLEEVLAKSRFESAPSPESVADRVTPRGRTPVHAPSSSEVELSTRLMKAVSLLDVPYQHERSVRLAPGTMDGNRYLLTCNLADLGSDRYEKVMGVVDQVGFPAALRDTVRAWMETAACVHFGFEEQGGRSTCKLYLEQALDFERSGRGASEPVLLHRACKWQPQDGSHVATRYVWHPALDAEALTARVDDVLARSEQSNAAAFVRNALALALGKVDAEKIAYLAVTEDGNPRDSFDLNFYEAGLQIRALQQGLFALRESFGIPPGRFQALYDQIRGRQLGHIAGGIHRNGEAFVTIYYGLAGFPRFNANLGAGRGAAKRSL